MQHDVISVQAQGTPLEENCSEKCSTGVAPPDSFSRSTSATGANVPNENRVLRIVPRTKTVQSRRVQRTVNAVEVTADTIRGLSSVSETEAAASLNDFWRRFSDKYLLHAGSLYHSAQARLSHARLQEVAKVALFIHCPRVRAKRAICEVEK
eukprot:2902973-Rhodomonas_salina.1